MKTIWFINHYASTIFEAGSTRHFQLSKAMQKLGWSTRIFTASTKHPEGNQRAINFGKTSKLVDGVLFQWVKVPNYSGNNIFRALNILVFFVKICLVFVKKHEKPDFIVGSTVHPLASLAAFVLSKRLKCGFIYEVRDLWPESLVALQKVKRNSTGYKILYYLDKSLFENSEFTITVMENAYLYYKKYDNNLRKILYLPNGISLISPSNNKPSSKSNRLFIIRYIGNISEVKDLETLLIARANLRKSNNKDAGFIKVEIIGDGPYKLKLLKLKQKLQLSSQELEFLPSVDKINVSEKCESSNLLVILNKNTPELYQYGISMNKLFDYMKSKVPIIIATPLKYNPVEKAKCGITVTPENPEALANGIIQLYNLTQIKRDLMGENGYKYVCKHHEFGQLAKKLDLKISELKTANIK